MLLHPSKLTDCWIFLLKKLRSFMVIVGPLLGFLVMSAPSFKARANSLMWFVYSK